MMRNWNVLASVHETRGYGRAQDLLREYGPTAKTDFMDVLVVRAREPHAFLEKFREQTLKDPSVLTVISRVLPVSRTFNFQNATEFEAKAREAVRPWIEELSGQSFHVRVHRRGFKGRISSPIEERLLAEFVMDELERQSKTASIDLENSDFVIDIETIGQEAGVSLWRREELERYPFLKTG